jgi:signal transduction histidine kinase
MPLYPVDGPFMRYCVEKRAENHFIRFKNKVASVLLERRWLILILLGLSALIFEILEHQHVENPVDAHFVREVVFFAIIYPIGVGLLLNMLLKSQEQRNYVLRQREIEQKLNQDLISAPTWEQLCKKIVDFPATVTPAVGVRFCSLFEQASALKLEMDWWIIERSRRPALETPIPLNFCGVTHQGQKDRLHLFVSQASHAFSTFNGYCLPLHKDHNLLGFIYIYLPSSQQLSLDQISILNAIAPVIALALDNARRQQQPEPQAVQFERERIARQLHNTLGQNLAYLRLKLDQISSENAWQEGASIQHDLERMRDVAHESHDQIRQALDSLKPEGTENLQDLLQARLEEAAAQASFTVHTKFSGQPGLISPTVQRKIHSIFREALSNIVRHANARTVSLSIDWDASTNSLRILLEDDGVGFVHDQVLTHDCFGLIIMQQRAEEIQADLKIRSAPGKGAQVELRCTPLTKHSAGLA